MLVSNQRFRILLLLTTTLFGLVAFAQAYVEKCNPTVDFVGYTHPQGDIYVEYGKGPLEINCTINNPENYNVTPSDYLYFEAGNEIVDSSKIQKINSSTIRFYDPNPPLQNLLYHCKFSYGHKVSCLNKVIVGEKPSPVKDFKCLSKNWDNLTCSWSVENNTARVTYRLLYNVSANRRGNYKYECNVETTDSIAYCLWTPMTDPLYRSARDTFNFDLIARNKFGNTTNKYTFAHYRNILPNRPTYVNYTEVGTNHIYLTWGVPQTLVAFPNALKHRIMHFCKHDEKPNEWKIHYIESIEQASVSFNLTNLENKYDMCDIRIAIKVNDSEIEDLWSQNVSKIIRTLADKPAMAPKTTVGSFQIVNSGSIINSREVYVYWSQIPERFQNGKNFTYNIQLVNMNDEEKSYVKLIEKTNSYARFKNLSKILDYTFEVYSENANGTSDDRNYVTIAKDGSRASLPRVHPKIDYSEGNYGVSWNSTGPVDNYTIFWCNNDRDRPHQCQGMLNWTTVPSSVTSYKVTVEEKGKVTQFAVSANGKTGSSGMHWITCTIIDGQSYARVKNIYVNKVTSRSIELQWTINCEDGIANAQRYVIYYCIVPTLDKQCEAPQQNITVDGSKAKAVIENLKPYTTYKMTMAVLTQNAVYSEQSDPIYNVTLEDVPSDIEFIEEEQRVDNNSIHIVWKPPTISNGVITAYQINLNDSKRVIVNDRISPINMYDFKNLDGFVNYTISISACTTSCAKPKSKFIRTKVGRPEKITTHLIKYENKNHIFEWTEPKINGPRDTLRYDVAVYLKGGINETQQYRDETSVNLNSFCSSTEQILIVKVRAVTEYQNVDYVGDWSDIQEYSCHQSVPYLKWIWMVLSLIVVIFIGFVVQRSYLRCKQMTDVQVKLPPGLQLPPGKDGFSASWSTPSNLEPTAPSADEEHLLEKLNDGRLSGDSSGCSSGHDSVSSLESGNQVSSSSSDSGTEQPPSPDESNFLRRRKAETTVSKPYVTVDSVSNWKPVVAPSPQPAGNYCVLGVNPIVENEPDTTYVPIMQPINITPSKGYVTCPIAGDTSQPWPSNKSPPSAANYCVLGLNPEVSASKGYVSADAFTTK